MTSYRVITQRLLAILLVVAFIGGISPVSISAADINSGLVSHWKFDESSGTAMADSVGNSSGALVNGPIWTPGKVGNGLFFDGIDDGIRVTTNSSANNLQAFTFSSWIYPTKNGGTIFRKGGNSSAAYFNIFTLEDTGQSDTGQLGIRVGYTQQTGAWRTRAAVPLNSWHHIVVEYTVGSISAVPTFYIDGQKQDMYQKYEPIGTRLADDTSAFIGNNHNLTTSANGVFRGIIDEARLYNRLLTLEEVTTLYQLVTATPTNNKPNIVVIMTDDQDDMGSMAAMPKTRNLIGSQGLTFTNSFVDFSLCCPSRVSFLTGQASHNTGVLANGGSEGGYAKFKPTQANSLPVWLQQAGYTTVHMGKYPNGFLASDGIPPGWNVWQGIADDQGGYSYYNYYINENGTLNYYRSTAADYKTDVQAKKAADFIVSQQNSSQPFFLWLAPLAPHTNSPEVDSRSGAAASQPALPAPRHVGTYSTLPLPQPPNFNETDVSDKPGFVKLFPVLDSATITGVIQNFRSRRESLLAVDDMVEKVVNALQSAGKLDNTIIVFTSDNGYFEGQHRRQAEKMLAYEESIRVPLLIRGPGISKGQTRSQLVNNLDLVATIEELASVNPGRTPDGRSLKSTFLNAGAPWRSSLLVQGMDKVYGNSYLYGRFQAVRTKDYIYIEHNGTDFGLEQELYNLVSDPYQLQNKASDPAYASVLADLKARLATLRTCSGSSCWMSTSAPALITTSSPTTYPQTPTNTTPYNPLPPTYLPDGTIAQPMTGGSYNFGTVTLRYGSSGSAVMDLQRFLNNKLSLSLVVDGKLGLKTTAAIKTWQTTHALVADGLVGPMTRASMYSAI